MSVLPSLENGKAMASGFKESGLLTPTSATIVASKDSNYATISQAPDRGDGPASICSVDVDPAPVRDASSPLPDSPGLEYPDPFEAILERPVAPAFHTIPMPTHGQLLMKHSSEHAAQRAQLLPKISHYRSHPPSFPRTTRPPAPKRSIQKVMHFNSRGEIIQRSGEPKCPPMVQQQPPALQNPYPNPNVDIRLCMRFGCGSILKANAKDTAAPFCQMCIESGQVTSDTSEGRLSSNPYSRLISTEKVKVPPIPFISHGPAPPGDQALGTKKNNITVPSSFPMKTSPFTSQPLPVPPPLTYRVPTQHPIPHDTVPTQSRPQPPRPRQHASRPSQPPTRPVIKTCSTPGCNGIMHMQGTSKRCHSCVMKEWKGKMKAMKAQSVPSPKAELTHSKATQQEDPTVSLGPGPNPLPLVNAEQAPQPDHATQPKITITLPPMTASKPVLSPKLLGDISISPKPPQQSVILRIPSKRKLADLPDSTDGVIPGKACSSAFDKQSPPIRTPAPMVTDPGPSITADQRPPAAADSSLLTPPPTSQNQQGRASPEPSSSQETAMDIDTPEPSGFTGWDSDLTSISDLEDSSDEESESERPRLVIRLPARSFSKHIVSSHDDDKEGRNSYYRVKEPPVAPDGDGPRCVIKKCGILLPEGYTWKLCRACRERNREYQRKRLGVTKGTYTIAKEVINPTQCDISPPQVATQNHASTSTARICVLKNCGEVLPAMTDYPYKLCRDCRKRTTKTRKRRQLRAQGKEDAELDREIATLRTRWRHRRTDRPVTTSEQLEESPPQKVSNAEPRVSIYPEYSSLLPLVAEFGKRLGGFFDVHAVYIHHNTPSLSPKTLIQFGFDGEYSVVAMDADIMARKDAIIDFVVRVKGELERVGGLQFDSRSMLVNFKHGGILTRFGGQQKVGHMVMQGELEIAILPEYSHLHFPGQRTVVRFRLVG